MKNPKNLLSLSLVISTLLFISCGEQTKESEDAEKRTGTEVEAPEQIISIEEAKSMYDDYTKRRVGLIQKFEDSINVSKKDTTKFDVARYTFYDYKTIKQYLEYIEKAAEEAGVEISTLRFYHSNYPDQEKFANGKPIVHPRQNSVFIIPAMEFEGEQYAFTTEETGEAGKKRAVLLTMDLEPYQPEGMGINYRNADRSHAGVLSVVPFTSAAYGRGSTALNQGGAAPPPYQ